MRDRQDYKGVLGCSREHILVLSDELTFEQVPVLREDPSSEATKIKNLKNPVAGTKRLAILPKSFGSPMNR
jgi:hypothetical protein